MASGDDDQKSVRAGRHRHTLFNDIRLRQQRLYEIIGLRGRPEFIRQDQALEPVNGNARRLPQLLSIIRFGFAPH